GMQKCLTLLRDEHKVDEDPAIVAPFLERQRLVNKYFWDALEKRYS
ncbi:carboxyvinyl-carboxyphosphonate phosphorylmutase, partial [Comamonas jiangduensis]